MPFAIHPEATKKMMEWNISRPQETVPEVLPENWQSTPGRGLPVKEIPFLEYPRCVYLHPLRPFRELEHRNNSFELVGTEKVPTEHLTKLVQNEAELKAALDEGWVTHSYIPEVPAKPDADLYARKKNLLEERKEKK